MAVYYNIPEGSVEIQPGLWLHTSTFTFNNVEYLRRKLYASEGYCFYDPNDDAYDAENNLIRMYYTYMSLAQTANVDNFISILVEEGMEIAGVVTKPEIA